MKTPLASMKIDGSAAGGSAASSLAGIGANMDFLSFIGVNRWLKIGGFYE